MDSKRFFTISENLLEIRAHGNYAFPFEYLPSSLSRFINGCVECHWHTELELIIVTSGQMVYYVNEASQLLTAGAGILVNSNCIHMTKPSKEPCEYHTFIFHPRMVYGFENSLIQQKYCQPIIDQPGFSYFFFDPSIDSHRQFVEHACRLAEFCASQEESEVFHLDIQLQMLELWKRFYALFQQRPHQVSTSYRQNTRVKQMLNYIHGNYTQKVTLQDIAAAGNLCAEECSRVFKRVLHQSPIEYLTYYRIQKSLPLFEREDMNITEIAFATGFNSSKYFSEVFKRYMGVSPSQHAKTHAK